MEQHNVTSPLVSKYGRERKLKRPKAAEMEEVLAASKKRKSVDVAVSPTPHAVQAPESSDVNLPVDFELGTIVWAHLGKYPWWPSLVCDDPLKHCFTMVKKPQGRGGEVKTTRWYHVLFFGDGNRNWVSSSSLLKYDGQAKFLEYVDHCIKSAPTTVLRKKFEQKFMMPSAALNYKSRLDDAIGIADKAISLSPQERIKHYSLQPVSTNASAHGSTKQQTSRHSLSPAVVGTTVSTVVEKVKRRKTIGDIVEGPKFKSLSPKVAKTLKIIKHEKNEPPSSSTKATKTVSATLPELSKDGQAVLPVNGHDNTLADDKLSNGHSPFESSAALPLNSLERISRAASPSNSTSSSEIGSQADPNMLPLYYRNPLQKLTNFAPKDPICLSCYQSALAQDLRSCLLCSKLHHPKCLEITGKCKECTSSEHSPTCFACEKSDGTILKCSIASCFKYYHIACIEKCYFKKLEVENNGTAMFHCPLHFCVSCAVDRNPRTCKGRLVQCVNCPVAYHRSDYCIPAGTELLSRDYVRCNKHFDNQVKLGHINVRWCFLCSKGGSLVCCEKCPTAFHWECLELRPDDVDGDFYCDDCILGRRPLYGDIVWMKLGSYRWWPASVTHPANIPDNVEQLPHQPGDFVVRFFGSHDYYWTSVARVFLFYDGDQGTKDSAGKTIAKVFTKAVEEASAAYQARKQDLELKELYEEQLCGKDMERYRPIKTNKALPPVQVRSVEPEDHPQCKCSSDSESPCGEECLNRMLHVECHPKVCKAGVRCQNQRFQKCEYVDCVPFRTTDRGWGLKSKQFIKKGTFVCEYVGEVISNAEFRQRLKQKNAQSDHRFYFLRLDGSRVIDAGPKGNVARFMNHSCSPNCSSEKWQVLGDTRIGLFASRDITVGEELTFHYNADLAADEYQKCQCKAANCLGFIGSQPKAEVLANDKPKLAAKRKRKLSIKFQHENVCFRCGDGGELIMCDRKLCPKVYHLSCLNMDRPPKTRWECPWHYCSECPKPAHSLCVLCDNSYCAAHASTNIAMLDNKLVCISHAEEFSKADKDVFLPNSTPVYESELTDTVDPAKDDASEIVTVDPEAE